MEKINIQEELPPEGENVFFIDEDGIKDIIEHIGLSNDNKPLIHSVKEDGTFRSSCFKGHWIKEKAMGVVTGSTELKLKQKWHAPTHSFPENMVGTVSYFASVCGMNTDDFIKHILILNEPFNEWFELTPNKG